ncbi:MAG: ATP-binding cassette domain-containing protein [Proteobacteria bacterium]|nr:ATP-binding cassette domain-containing protein [Pseudomonadota bacterium]
MNAVPPPVEVPGEALAAPAAGPAGPAGPAVLSGSPFSLPAAAPVAPGDGASPGASYGALAGIVRPNDLSASLLPLLETLGWRGHPQQVAEALPHFQESFDITALRNVLAALGYQSSAEKTALNEIVADMVPCLFLPEGRDALVVADLDADNVEAFDTSQGRYVSLPREAWTGTAYVFSPLDVAAQTSVGEGGNWLWAVGKRFKGRAFLALGITFLLNLLALALPLFVMAVYDQAIATGSVQAMSYLAIGAGIAVVSDLILRTLRSRIFSFVGARLDNIVGVEVFRKILQLPAAMIERAAIGAQASRIKAFETIREFLTGPAAPLLFELPFVLVFIAVVATLGGAIAFVPIVILALVGGLGLAVMPRISEAVAKDSEAETKKQELTIEILSAMRAIKYCGAEATWLGRYRQLSADAALRGFYSAQFTSLLETVSYVVMVASGFATVAIGASRVEAGDMSYGALAACMILVWRALAPLQAGLVSLTRVAQVESGVDHLNDLMRIETTPVKRTKPAVRGLSGEGPDDKGPGKGIEGRITFTGVTMHYEADSPPALDGASFEIKSGKIIAVLGSNGAGKSTMFKLLTGLYRATSGSIQIDGRDIRNISPAELRQAIAYVPQTPQFFYGTIAQNLRLAHPTATDDDLRWAVRQAGALEDIEALEQGSGDWKRTGFDVRLGDRGSGQVSPGLLQRLNLARGYLKRAPIVLLDEPGNGLDQKGDQALMQAMSNMRGEKTVFIVTHRPSHLKMADRIIWLEYGSVRSVGRPKVVMPKTPGNFL